MPSAADYRTMLQKHLPTGEAWRRDAGAGLTALLGGFSQEYARFDARISDLLREMDPRTAVELLPNWERLLGLPDTCSVIATTIPGRQLAAFQKLTSQGGQTPAFFIGLAGNLGFTATILEYRPTRIGDHIGDLLYDHAWRFAWRMSITAETGSVPHGVLECVVGRARPAHTTVSFGYP